MNMPQGAIVQILESGKADGPIIPDRVLINGVSVGLVRRFQLDVGGAAEGSPTVLTLELYPRQVIIGTDET